MIEINLIKLLILNIILFNKIIKTFQEEICSVKTNCENCNKCEVSENSCKYGNLFCQNSNSYFFFSDLKSSYINYFLQNIENQNICGDKDIYLSEIDSYKIIKIGKSNYNYLLNNELHCFYQIKNLFNYEYDIYISFSVVSSNNNLNNNKLSLSIYLIFENFLNNYYSDLNIRNTNKIIKLNGLNEFYIMLDVNKINNNEEELEENLIINIYAELKHRFNNHNNLPPNKDKESSKRKNYKIYYVITGGLISLFILAIIIIKNCLKRKLYRNRDNERNNLENDEKIDYLQQIENRKKIEYLFNTKLYPKKYTNINGDNEDSCSICLDNFIEEKNLISLTPCGHIFHYQCLKKWAEEKKEQFKCPNCNFDFLKENEPITLKVQKKTINVHNNLNSDNNFLEYRINRNNNNTDTLRSTNILRYNLRLNNNNRF